MHRSILPAAILPFFATSALIAEDAAPDVAAKAAQIVPSPQQLDWQRMEFIAFTHFGMNTFTNREWGEGNEDPKLFNPTEFDARQWVRVCKAAGMKMIIVTAKHHDGFCLWPSKYTDHCVKSSPWKDGKGDVIREVADACREGGLKFGLYCSPWDRHERSYGTDAYNEHFKNQLRELLTDYGPLTEVWFDGACGEGPNGKKQVYDWDGYYALIRKLQPNALIAIAGPDIRWVGNESGHSRESEWSVLNMPPSGGPDFTTADLGSRPKLGNGKHLKWYPAEADVSIRPGWFHHPAEQPRALPDLINIYYDSVGRNAVLLLNVPPDKRGLICESDVKRLGELRAAIDAAFKTDLTKGKPITASSTATDKPDHAAGKLVDGDPATSWMPGDQTGPVFVTIDLGTETAIKQAMLQEDIAQGQRVEEFTLEAWRGDKWEPFAKATTIGYKRLLRFPEIKTSKVRLTITATRARPALATLGLFCAPNPDR